jgi:hypothetical protein
MASLARGVWWASQVADALTITGKNGTTRISNAEAGELAQALALNTTLTDLNFVTISSGRCQGG